METAEAIEAEMKFHRFIHKEDDLVSIEVHPRFEQFGYKMAMPPYLNSLSTIELHVTPTCPEYEMQLVYKGGIVKTISMMVEIRCP